MQGPSFVVVVFERRSSDVCTAYHHDEGSRFYVDSASVVNVTGNTYAGVGNDGCEFTHLHPSIPLIRLPY